MFFKKLLNKGYDADFCQLCKRPFAVLKLQRIHKCKRCQKFICQKCGQDRQRVIQDDGKLSTDKHRICRKCKLDYDIILQTITTNEMSWGNDSKLARQWLALIGDRDYEYEHFLRLFYRNQQNFLEEADIIDKDVIKGRTDYSVYDYSMREFFFIAQQNVEEKQAKRNSIANVLYALAARFDRIGYCQGMSGVAAFLLCFASENTAFCIFCVLLEQVYPENFFVRSNFGIELIGLLAQVHFLKEYYMVLIQSKAALLSHEREPYTISQIDHIQMVIQLVGTKALMSLFIGVLNFTNLIFVWKQLFRLGNFEVIQRSFLTIIYLNRNNILQHRSYKVLQQYFAHIDPRQFKQTYAQLTIDSTLRKHFIQQYYISTNKRWSANTTTNSHSLTKVTSYKSQQIECLQQHFAQSELSNDIVITQPQFTRLVACYYEVLKQSSKDDEAVLQISSYFVRKIFNSYNTRARDGLDFREFVCCLSVCTKSRLKDKMLAIVNTFDDKQNHISRTNFQKLIVSLCALSPADAEIKKQAFLERIEKYFGGNEHISISRLYILLNDNFINELVFLDNDSRQDTIRKTCQKYKTGQPNNVVNQGHLTMLIPNTTSTNNSKQQPIRPSSVPTQLTS